MTSMISPYALLKASKPKEAATFTKPYDLYSSIHDSLASRPQPRQVPLAQQETPAAPSAPMPAAPVRRTHYISDIQSRHSTAMRRAPQRNQPL